MPVYSDGQYSYDDKYLPYRRRATSGMRPHMHVLARMWAGEGVHNVQGDEAIGIDDSSELVCHRVDVHVKPCVCACACVGGMWGVRDAWSCLGRRGVRGCVCTWVQKCTNARAHMAHMDRTDGRHTDGHSC